MSAITDSLSTAFRLAALAASYVALAPRSPPRMRFAVAVTRLAAWLVPWGAIRIALPSSDTLVAALSGSLGVAAGFAPLGTSRGGLRHVGEIAVTNSPVVEIAESRLRSVP